MKTSYNILVIGDVMVDQYMKGVVRRKSPEADIPVLDQVTTIMEPGGAANVSLNAIILGSKATLIGVIGNDEKGLKLQSILEEKSISTEFIKDNTRPTTVKTRVFDGNKQLIRIDDESTIDCSEEIQKELIQKVKEIVNKEKFDIAILQDYNKGVLTKNTISKIIAILKSKNIFIAVDPKKKNFECYMDVNLFKPNMNEMLFWAKMDAKTEFDKNFIEKIGKNLRSEIASTTLLVTLSEHGAMYFSKKASYYKEAIPMEVVDVCGAGDAVILVAAMADFQNLNPSEVLEYCVKTGKIVCGKVGVSGITSVELHENFI